MSIKIGKSRRFRTTARFWLLMMGLMLLGFGISCIVSLLHIRRLDQELADLLNQRSAQLADLNALEARLDYVQTDAYVEAIARNELNLLYPGEIRYIAD